MDRAHWKPRLANGRQLQTPEADTPMKSWYPSWHPFHLLHDPIGSLIGSYIFWTWEAVLHSQGPRM